MNKVTELENALTELFRKGTEVGYSETEIDEFLEDIDYDTVDESMKNDIAVAERLRITATTLDGILTVKGQGRAEGGHRRE